MRWTTTVGAMLFLLAAAALVVAGDGIDGTVRSGEVIRVTTPMSPLPGRAPSPWSDTRAEDSGERVTPERELPGFRDVYLGENLTAVSLRLESDYAVERGFEVVGGVANSGTVDLYDVVARFFVGGPDYGIQIGDDVVIAHLAAGETQTFSVSWPGTGGSHTLYLLVDADESIVEVNETDNTDTLGVTLIDDVPWLSQIVNGYCNYAALTMLFNHYGAANTVYETVEFAGCAHSPVYIDDKFYMLGGVLSCQTWSDYEFAGEIRNLETDTDVSASWILYTFAMRQRIDAGIPFETGVDPYYLPQADYEILRTLDVHSGHAVVVTGYTDSSVVINDPGVGIEFPMQPPIPGGELRGADVVVELESFRSAVELTLGTPRILISYAPAGPMQPHDMMTCQAAGKSARRLDGDPAAYDDATIHGWPPGWDPTLGANAFATAQSDMNQSTFEIRFWELTDAVGGDLEATLNALAIHFVDGLFWHKIAWDASRAFYETEGTPEADALASLADELTVWGELAYMEYYNMLVAIWDSGGNPAVAEPYLSVVGSYLGEIVLLEEQVLYSLRALVASGVPEGDEIGRPIIIATPNPFSTTTEIHWVAERGVDGELRIYDVAGRLVRELPAGNARGTLTVKWDGVDGKGRSVAAGVYLVRDSHGHTTKVVRL